MTTKTIDRRSLGLALAFDEWRPAHVSPEHRQAIEKLIDDWMRYFDRLREQIAGFAEAQALRKFIDLEFADEFEVLISQFPNEQKMPHLDAVVIGEGEFAKNMPFIPITSQASPLINQAASMQQQAWGGELIKGILGNSNLKDFLNNAMSQGHKEGLSRDQLAARIRAAIMDDQVLPEWRARLIAQTEAMRNYNALAHQSYKVYGGEYMKWLDGQAGACASCSKLHGQVIPITDAEGDDAHFVDTLRGFVVQHPPLHPGCRCTIIGADDLDFKTQEQDAKWATNVATKGGIGGSWHAPSVKVTSSTANPNPKAAKYTIDDAYAEFMDAMNKGTPGLSAYKNALAKLPPGEDFIGHIQGKIGVKPGASLGITIIEASDVALGFKIPPPPKTPKQALIEDIESFVKATGIVDDIYVTATNYANAKGIPVQKVIADLEDVTFASIYEKVLLDDIFAIIAKYPNSPITSYQLYADKAGLTLTALATKIKDTFGGTWADLVAKQKAVLPAGVGTPFGSAFKKEVDDWIEETGYAALPGDFASKFGMPIDDALKFVNQFLGPNASWNDYKTDLKLSKPAFNKFTMDDYFAKNPGATLADTMKHFGKSEGDIAAIMIQAQGHAGFYDYTKAIAAKTAPKVDSGGVAFKAPVESEIFMKWYEKYGEGKIGVAAFQAYAKKTGKTMNQIKADIEVEGYTLPQLIGLVKAGTPLSSVAPKVVPPKKKATPKPPGTATVAPAAKPDTTFKNALTPNSMPDPDDWAYWEKTLGNKTGPQMGSNTGGVFTGPDGKQYYAKQYSRSPDQAKAEAASHAIHDLLGIGYPKSRVVDVKGATWYISEMYPGLKQLSAAEWKKMFAEHPELGAKIHVAASFTANWDVVGKTYDNLLWDDVAKKPVIIDAGGTWKWRAQGGSKPFNAGVPDFDTLLDKSVNANAAAVFGDLYKTQAGIDAAIAAATHIKNMLPVYKKSLPSALSGLGPVLDLRIDDILGKLNLKKPPVAQPKLKPGQAPPWVGPNDFDAIEAKVPAVARPDAGGSKAEKDSFGARWGGSASSDPAMVAKMYMREHLFGISPEDAYIDEMKRVPSSGWAKASPISRDQLVATWRQQWKNLEARTSYSRETMLATWEENQAILRARHPSGYVTLHRGTGRNEDELRRLKADIQNTGSGKWYASPLVSFSTSKAKANDFGGKALITIKVPISMIFAEHTWLKKHGNYHTEYEYIVITGPEGWTLTADNVDFKYFSDAQPEYDPNGFAFEWSPSEAEERAWHKHMSEGSKQNGQSKRRTGGLGKDSHEVR